MKFAYFYYPFGTTVYALAHQEESIIEETLDTLKNSPFNKVRMCVFPKHCQYNNNEPRFYPFEKMRTNRGMWRNPVMISGITLRRLLKEWMIWILSVT